MKNILITSAGRRVELVQFFKKESKKKSNNIKIFCTDQNPKLSPACQVADLYFKAPSVNHEKYINFLKQKCIDNLVALIIPTIDTELLLLSQYREEFMDLGINIIISDSSLIEICRNKNFTSHFLNSIEIDTPKILDKKNLTYPCFVKPYDGSSSIGTFILKNKSELTKQIFENPKNMFMELIPKSFKEYTVDIYYNKFGALRCLVPRLRIETRAGEVSKGLTSRNIVYDYLKEKLSYIKGARGCITLQLFVNLKEKSFKVLEINPRFGGGYPLSYAAGANFPRMLMEEYMFDEDVEFLNNWEENLLMLRYDSKVLVHDYRS